VCRNKERIETYEKSRQRNDNHNISASSSLARAGRSVGSDSMARPHGSAKQESKRKTVKPTQVDALPLWQAVISTPTSNAPLELFRDRGLPARPRPASNLVHSASGKAPLSGQGNPSAVANLRRCFGRGLGSVGFQTCRIADPKSAECRAALEVGLETCARRRSRALTLAHNLSLSFADCCQ